MFPCISWGIVLAIALTLAEVLPMSFSYYSVMAKSRQDCPLGPWGMVFGCFGTQLLALCTTKLYVIPFFIIRSILDILIFLFFWDILDCLDKVRPHSADVRFGMILSPYCPSPCGSVDMCFIDVACIHQTDKKLMQRGIRGIGGLLWPQKRQSILLGRCV